MKVLHVIDRLAIGGAEKVFVDLTRLLVDAGIKTAALLFEPGYPLEQQLNKKLPVHILHRSNKFSLRTMHKAHKICSRYNIVHAHLRHVHAYLQLAKSLFNGKYILLLHDHAGVSDKIPTRLKGIFKPRHYIGVNSRQVQWAKERVGVDTDHVFLLENTVIPSSTVYERNIKASGVMMVANIRRVKNIEFAVELCRQLDWELMVYGNVIDSEYYAELVKNENIIITEGVTDFNGIYNNFKLAIHCSLNETGPLVLQEYLAAGIPFLAYNTGSTAETIAKHFPQLFMNDFNPGSWMTRVQEIIKDASLPGKMRNSFQHLFNTDEYVDKCLGIYRKIYS